MAAGLERVLPRTSGGAIGFADDQNLRRLSASVLVASAVTSASARASLAGVSASGSWMARPLSALVWLAVLWLFVGPSLASQPDTHGDDVTSSNHSAESLGAASILVFGDSLSAAYGLAESDGWVAGLADALRERGLGDVKVTNASISGETTAGGRARFDAAMSDANPDFVILQLGANDGLRGLSLESMRDHLRTMMTTAEEADAKVVLLGVRLPPSLGRRYLEAFDRVYADLGAKAAAYHPFFVEVVAEKPELLQDDGLHPTREAQPLILGTVVELIAPLLESRDR